MSRAPLLVIRSRIDMQCRHVHVVRGHYSPSTLSLLLPPLLAADFRMDQTYTYYSQSFKDPLVVNLIVNPFSVLECEEVNLMRLFDAMLFRRCCYGMR